jgi:hypothetical protein
MSEAPVSFPWLLFDFGRNQDDTSRWAQVRPLDYPNFVARLARRRAEHPVRHDRSARVRRQDTMRAVAECCFAPVHGKHLDGKNEPIDSAWYDDAGRLIPSSDTLDERLAILSRASFFANVMLVLKDRETFAALAE